MTVFYGCIVVIRVFLLVFAAKMVYKGLLMSPGEGSFSHHKLPGLKNMVLSSIHAT